MNVKGYNLDIKANLLHGRSRGRMLTLTTIVYPHHLDVKVLLAENHTHSVYEDKKTKVVSFQLALFEPLVVWTMPLQAISDSGRVICEAKLKK
jgi:hypothetical protein